MALDDAEERIDHHGVEYVDEDTLAFNYNDRDRPMLVDVEKLDEAVSELEEIDGYFYTDTIVSKGDFALFGCRFDDRDTYLVDASEQTMDGSVNHDAVYGYYLVENYRDILDQHQEIAESPDDRIEEAADEYRDIKGVLDIDTDRNDRHEEDIILDVDIERFGIGESKLRDAPGTILSFEKNYALDGDVIAYIRLDDD